MTAPGPAHILLIDDSEIALDALSPPLVERGFRVTTAASGSEALAQARQGTFDLVICDLHMPDISGIEVMDALHAQDESLPVIILSGDAELPAVLRAVRSGAVDYVPKERHYDGLLAAVERAVTHGRVVRDNLRLSSALRAANASLEQRVRDRTEQVEESNRSLVATQKALERALAAARAASEAKSQFLANMSHEIRTPMTGLIGLLDLVLGTDLTTDQRGHLALAQKSADALLQLMNDLLDFSRVDAGKIRLEAAPFRLRSVIDESTRLLAVAAQERSLSLVHDIAPGLPDDLVGDAGRLRQILFNLGSNAVKFTDQGGVRITVEEQARTQNVVVFHFAVSDTGIGIAADKLDRLFAPFVQVDSSASRRRGGAGLGLSICSRLVEMMGGRIWVESAPGRGSTFHFTVRMLVSDERAPAPAPARVTPRPGGRRRLSTRYRILVAEDHPVNQHLTTTLLREYGCDVSVVGDGRRAIEALARERYDVVFMDVQMPDIDGTEAARQIRAQEQGSGRHVPIVAVTANVMKGDRERYLAAGMDAYLSKPFHATELYAALDAALKPELAAPRADVKALIDWERVLERLDGNEALLRRMLEQFAATAGSHVQAIETALAAGDGVAAHRAAHTLRGAALSVGLTALAEQASELETAAGRGEIEGAQSCYAGLRREVDQLLLVMRD